MAILSNKCHNCAYFETNEPDDVHLDAPGRCHMNLHNCEREYFLDRIRHDARIIFPRVKGTDWCSKFSPKPGGM